MVALPPGSVPARTGPRPLLLGAVAGVQRAKQIALISFSGNPFEGLCSKGSVGGGPGGPPARAGTAERSDGKSRAARDRPPPRGLGPPPPL
jgi:hypothetical protein